MKNRRLKYAKQLKQSMAFALSLIMIFGVLVAVLPTIGGFAEEIEEVEEIEEGGEIEEVEEYDPINDIDFNERTGEIVGYNGASGVVLVIPAEIKGVTVTAIGNSAFQNAGLAGVVLPDTITSIGDNAFQGTSNSNILKDIIIPDSVTSIGSFAFDNAGITSVNLHLPESLESLGECAFRNNHISGHMSFPDGLTEIPRWAFALNSIRTVDLDGIVTIGDSAFRGNFISEVTLPDSLVNYGNCVFLSNDGFVILDGNTSVARIYDAKGLSGEYGEFFGGLCNSITIYFKDIESGNDIWAPSVEESSTYVSNLSELMLVGNEYTYPAAKIPKITGFIVIDGDDQTFTITQDDEEYTIWYKDASALPRFEGPEAQPLEKWPLQFALNETVTLIKFLDGIKAIDFDDSELTLTSTNISGWDDIWKDLDTSVPDILYVTYRVTGQNGTGTATRAVMIGDEPMDRVIGNGWKYSDFEYSDDGSVLLGFSPAGLDRYYGNGMFSVPNTNVWLPGVCPIAPDGSMGVMITKIDDSDTSGLFQFRDKDFSVLNFGKMDNLQIIADETFRDAQIYTLNLNTCKKLSYIGDGAFKNAPLSSLTIDECYALRVIGDFAFENALLSSLSLSKCELLSTIGVGVFYRSPMMTLDLSGCKSLKTIGQFVETEDPYDDYMVHGAFHNAQLAALDLSECTSLETIGNNAFYNSEIQTLNLSKSLKEIGVGAFYSAPLNNIGNTLNLSGFTSLEKIGDGSFYNAQFTSLNLKGCENLTSIGYQYINESDILDSYLEGAKGAFGRVPLTSLSLDGCSSLEVIGNSTFAGNSLTTVNLSGCPNLKYLGGNAFSTGNMVAGSGGNSINTLDMTGLTKLEFIGEYAFANAHIIPPNFFMDGLDSLRSVGNRAFNNSMLMKFDFSKSTLLTHIGDYAFYSSIFSELDFTKSTLLQYIGDGAFENGNAGLNKLDFSNCALLTYIGNRAFYGCRNLTELNLSGCESLRTIGDEAFCYALITELDFTGCSALYSIGKSAFEYLSSNSSSKLDFTGCPELYSIGDRAFYWGHFTEVDFSGCSDLYSIGDNAFRYAGNSGNLTKVDFSGCSKLYSIGIRAFQFANGGSLSKVDFSGCSSLYSVGNEAFQQLRLYELDLSGCSSLYSIGDAAFQYAVTELEVNLDLSDCASLYSIGSSAFYSWQLDELDLRNNTSLASIGSAAFFNIKNDAFVYIPDSLIDLFISYPYNYSATIFGAYVRAGGEKNTWVFTNPASAVPEDITFLETAFSGEVNIYFNKVVIQLIMIDADTDKVIGKRKITMSASSSEEGGSPYSVSAPFLADYELIGPPGYTGTAVIGEVTKHEFYYRRITTTIDLPGWNFTIYDQRNHPTSPNDNHYKIGRDEFNIPYVMPIWISLSKSGAESEDDVIPAGSEIRIPVRDPNVDFGATTWGFMNDPSHWASHSSISTIWLDYETHEIVLVTKNLATGGSDFSIEFDLRYIEKTTPYNYTTDYRAYVITYNEDPDGKLLGTTDYDDPAEVIGWYDRGTITVYAGGKSIKDQGSDVPVPTFGTLSADGSFILPGTEVDVPFGLMISSGFRDLEGPHIVAFKLPTYKDRFGNTRVAKFSSSNSGTWHTEIIDGDTWLWTEVTKLSNVPLLYLQFPDIEIAPNQYIRAEAYTVVMPRNANDDEIDAYENGPLTTRYLNSSNGWTAENINYRTNWALIRTTTPDMGDIVLPTPTGVAWFDKFIYPHGSKYKNNGRGQEYRIMADDRREFLNSPEETDREFLWEVCLALRSDVFGKNLSIKDSSLDPRLYYVGVRNPFAPDAYTRESRPSDNNNIKQPTGFEVIAYVNDEPIIRVNTNDPEVIFAKEVSPAVVAKFGDTDPLDTVKRITSVEIRYPGFEFNKNLTTAQKEAKSRSEIWAILVTRLRDPFLDSETLSETFGNSESYNFWNKAEGHIDLCWNDRLEGGHEIGDRWEKNWDFNRPDEDYYRCHDVPDGLMSETMEVYKQNDPQGSYNNKLQVGANITYTLGITGFKSTKTVWNNFTMLDLLPEGVSVSKSDVIAGLDPRFKAYNKHLDFDEFVTVKDNYQGTRQTAIIFTAEEIKIPTYKFSTKDNYSTRTLKAYEYNLVIAKFKTTANYFVSSTITNEVYAKVENLDSRYYLEMNKRRWDSYGIHDGPCNHYGSECDEVSYDSKSNYTYDDRSMSLRKYISGVPNPDHWESGENGGITTKPGGDVYYKIELVSCEDKVRTFPIFYDIFPFYGDTNFDLYNSAEGKKLSRLSEFSNTFVEIILPDEIKGKYDVYYTLKTVDEGLENSLSFLENGSNWVSASSVSISDIPKVTGFKLVGREGAVLGPMGTPNAVVEFFVHMKAPLDPEGKLVDGARGYNSIIRSDSYQEEPLEANKVWNAIYHECSISLHKIDPLGNDLQGAVFELYKKLDESEYELVKVNGQTRWTTDGNGYVEFGPVPLGDYEIREVYAPDGLGLVSPITVEKCDMKSDEVLYLGEITDPCKYNIKLYKTDDEGKEGLKGAEFELRNAITGMPVAIETSAAPDGLVVFEDVPLASYKIFEIKAPHGFVSINVPIVVSKDDLIKGDLTVKGVTVDIGPVVNKPCGTVYLKKVDAIGNPLPNATFVLTGTQPGVNDHIEVTRKTDSNGEITFINDGNKTSPQPLPIGKYHIEEIASLENNFIPNYKKDFELTRAVRDLDLCTNESGVFEPIVNDEIDLSVYKIRLNLYMQSQNISDIELDPQDGFAMENVTFELWDEDETEMIDSGKTSDKPADFGQLVFKNVKANKIYIVKEILDEETIGTTPRNLTYKIKVDETGKTFRLFEGSYVEYTDDLIIANNTIKDEFETQIRKIDANTGLPLAGVEFDIYSKNGSGARVKTITLETNNYGIIKLTEEFLKSEEAFGESCPDELYVSEFRAPLGYSKEFGPDSERKINLLDKSQESITVTFKNTRTKLDIIKYTVIANDVKTILTLLAPKDPSMVALLNHLPFNPKPSDLEPGERILIFESARNQGLLFTGDSSKAELREPLAGALISVEEKKPKERITEGEVINYFEGRTGSDGKLKIPENFLIDETKIYIVTELEAPAGYTKVANKPQEFTVETLKRTPGFNGTVVITMDNAPKLGTLRVTKGDVSNPRLMLPGAKFDLYKLKSEDLPKIRDNCTYVGDATTDDDGYAEFLKLSFATYMIVEVGAPEGYELDTEEYWYTVNGDNTVPTHPSLDETTDIKHSINLKKVNEQGKELPGIEFYLQISYDGGQTWENYHDIESYPIPKTNQFGELSFGKLPPGLYRIIEHTKLPKYELPIFTVSGVNTNVVDLSGNTEKNVSVDVYIKNPDRIPFPLEGEKTWVHTDNKLEKYPVAIVVQLYANGVLYETKRVTAADGWKWKFEGLYKNDDEGNEIKYTIDEEPVDEYFKTIDGYDITNTYKGEVTLEGKKTWSHNGNKNPPKSITIYIMNGDEEVAKKEVRESDHWSWKITLPKYDDDGQEIKYTVVEKPVPGYTSYVNGYNIHNTFTITKGSGSVPKNPANTSDSVALPLIGIMASILSVAGMTLVFWYRKRRKTK